MLFFFSLSNAQSKIIKVNPLGLAFGIANAGFEFKTAENQSLTVSGISYNISEITGVGVGAEYRFYISGEALKDWHTVPSIGFFSLEDDANNFATVFSIAVEAGHQWIFGEHFALDIFAGYGFIAGDNTLNNLNQTSLSLGVSLGYA